MNRLRNRLIAIFLAATLVPLAATLWITTSLFDRSLSYASTGELDRLSHYLQRAGKELYRQACDGVKADALAGRLPPVRYTAAAQSQWPPPVRSFYESSDAERFLISGSNGNRIEYLSRRGGDVWEWSTVLGGVGLDELSREYRHAREIVEKRESRDLLRGFTYTYVLLAASVWIASLILLIYLAGRISHPIQQLTAGLSGLAAGNLSTRVEARRNDEVGRAIRAFNDMAERLQRSTERLVYLTQLGSWQSLARKMAHELKNSLTPIRLTVEEMLARYGESDRAFMEQATQIVAEEVESLERRVRAFSQFATEPPVLPEPLDLNALLEERITFLKTGHPEVAYDLRLDGSHPMALADQDLVKGILTNLLENAAEAAGEGGRILGVTAMNNGNVLVEVHDSGPGLSEQIRQSLFQPSISFKKGGMGLGLSISRRGALLTGGDIVLVKGELGGAGFRVLLPVASHGNQAHSDRG
ncbi:MAG TPA: ATP-binding protein [Bryobacteraceae bacterium]|nr:ATP-binding protein [Bryobacteraceae bacterium]